MKTMTVYPLRENKAAVGFAPWPTEPPPLRMLPTEELGVSDEHSLQVGIAIGVSIGLAARKPKKRKRKR